MIAGSIIDFAVGLTCIILGLLIWKKQKISILHSYHYKNVKQEDIYFAVKPEAVGYVLTKYLHPSQDELNPEAEKEYKARYPSLKDCKFFVINCRPNVELYALFASYRDTVIIVDGQL